MTILFSVTWGAVSGWWTPVCVLIGILYAWVLYRMPTGLPRTFRNLLFAARATVVFLIAFLLISPLVKNVHYNPEKPLIIIAQDNSESIKNFEPAGVDPRVTVNELDRLKETLGDQYDVHNFRFGQTLSEGLSNQFNERQTDISAALKKINETYVNQNIGAIILPTDGLYNQGNDPQYEAKKIRTSFYTIALGDTIPKRDLVIANINYNKTASLGNDFEIEVLVAAYQSKGETIKLNVEEDGRQVYHQNIAVTDGSFQKSVPVKLNADKKGLRKFVVSIAPVANETSVQNNTETIYVEVLDASQKILLIYGSPHPDIGVIKQAVERNKNFEVKTQPAADLASIKPADYSLVILYQITAANLPVLKNLVSKTKIPVWYLLGAQTNLAAFDQEQKEFDIEASRDQMQEVFALPDPGFSAFTLSDSTRLRLSQFPPLLAPFGNYSKPLNAQVLLRQKIGNIATSYTLLAFSDEHGRRTAVLAGEGLWRWQLAEFQAFGNHHGLEELLNQTIQYLTANDNRQRFRVYPAKTVFDEGERIIINAELYNEALELINTPDVKIELKSQQGKSFSFLFTRTALSYQLDAGILPSGEYTYHAAVALGKETLTASGQFTVKTLNLETKQTAANHQLLKAIAKQSGGQMLFPGEVDQLADLIRKNDNIKTVVYEEKTYTDLIANKSFFLLIPILLGGEWFLRKREGEI